ncbi:DUF1054 domain-containing protein [Paenibacillus protaetiae]|uniref:UPF0637 protein ET464_02845 n=1 Tax=Paenibacillus protaetiae TaxID=2509456 RepID=A0A4P6ER41_9BACL|nr:DUF1054 domain-containing protein [Paenibacillus protaetiae]QAY65470.1 DUF1054 domain-containing protein [Paenibacillus protaetiae]
MPTPTQTATGFTGFSQIDFDTFQIEGLEDRMNAIQQRIQPKFKQIGEELAGKLAPAAGQELFLHIAKHARRTVNPPKDTWLALCHNKRGYKAYPHFQIGLFDDHLFMWLAFIYEVPNKAAIASALLAQADNLAAEVPDGYMLSMDHMKKEAVPTSSFTKETWEHTLVRFRDVKKAELLIGRHIPAGDKLLQDGPGLIRLAEETFETLMPIYRRSLL